MEQMLILSKEHQFGALFFIYTNMKHLQAFNIFEAKFNKDKSTDEHIDEIEDILLEWTDLGLFNVQVTEHYDDYFKYKRDKKLGNSVTRSYEIRLTVDKEIARKNGFLDHRRGWEGGLEEVINDRKAQEHIRKYITAVKERLSRFNYQLYKDLNFDNGFIV